MRSTSVDKEGMGICCRANNFWMRVMPFIDGVLGRGAESCSFSYHQREARKAATQSKGETKWSA